MMRYSAFCGRSKEKRKRKTYYRPFVSATYLFAKFIHFTASIQTARQAGHGALHEAESAAVFRCICFVKLIHVFGTLESVWDEKGEGTNTAEGSTEEGTKTRAWGRALVLVMDGP